MIVVSDTTPLISLLKVEHLSLIKDLFGQILIPGAVFDELVSNPRFSEEAQKIMEADYIIRTEIEDRSHVDLLHRATGLDLGESESIWLCDSRKADLLLMDEAKGRQIAKQMGLSVMGTIGMLMVSAQEGLLTKSEIEICITTLRQNGRHISESLYQQLLDRLHSEK